MTSTYDRQGHTNTGQTPGSSDDSCMSVAYPNAPQAVSTAPQTPSVNPPDTASRTTAIEQCVQHELSRYFDMLDGEEPAHLYRMVMKQAESAVIRKVMAECRGNQTRASLWLGISRGNLRTKLANMEN